MNFSRRELAGLAALLAASTAVLVWGWREFWFLTDDAFISFRYVSNSLLGHGYVWNAPPFRPVEGYTSFLWVLLLDLVWRFTGAPPTQAANLISLGFSWAAMLLGAVMVLRMGVDGRPVRQRVLLAALFLLGLLTNRTFLAWTSSGLETAMFNFFLLLWAFCGFAAVRRGGPWLAGASLSALLITLTRPDGLLFAVATLVLIGVGCRRLRDGLVAALPLLGIVAHLLWRHWFYGQWLPNTYYAKHTAGRIWPESGARYLATFLMEYALWSVVLVFLVLLVVLLRRHGPAGVLRLLRPTPALVVAGTFLAHAWYYTVVIGGDHFEFRVYSHLVPLLLLALISMLLVLRLRPAWLVTCCLLALTLSWPVQWTHHALSQQMTGWQQFKFMKVSVADRFGSLPLVSGYLGHYDRMQHWLIDHAVCMRHQEHKQVLLHRQANLPSREEGGAIGPDGFPVITEGSVGLTAWVLPRVNVIDTRGLNDHVIARHRREGPVRLMAHERVPPPGYLEGFRPNVTIARGQAVVRPRQPQMTAAEIIDCEERYAQLVEK